MSIYLAMTLGTFACIIAMRRADGPVEKIADLAGLARTKPAMAFFLATITCGLWPERRAASSRDHVPRIFDSKVDKGLRLATPTIVCAAR